MVLHRVVKQSGDHHVFGDRKADVACFAHDQRSYAQQMSHERDAGAFAGLDVEMASIVNGAHKPLAEVQRRIRL